MLPLGYVETVAVLVFGPFVAAKLIGGTGIAAGVAAARWFVRR